MILGKHVELNEKHAIKKWRDEVPGLRNIWKHVEA